MSEESPKEEKASEKPADGKKILIIDDDAGNLRLVESILTKNGFEVIKAESGEKGVAIAKEQLPNLVITDVLMPGMDGYQVFKELRDDEKTQTIPVLILTIRKKMEDSFLASGAESFFAKPFQTEAFVKKVTELASFVRPVTKPKTDDAEAPAEGEPAAEEKKEEKAEDKKEDKK